MTPNVRRRDVIKGAGGAGIAGLAGCTGGGGGDGDDGGDGGDGGATPTATTTQDSGGMGRTIRMGILMGVTGGLASLGPPIRNGAMMAVNQINDADTPFEVETQFEDTATDPNQGISGGNALVNAGFPMICGALASGVTLQVAQNVAIPNGVPMCSPASTAPSITTLEDDGLVFRTPPTDALQGAVLASIATERLDAASAATLYVNNDYGQLLSEAFSGSFEEAGGTAQTQVSFEQDQPSYTAQLQSALADDPDTLLVIAYPESGGTIFRDFYSEFDRDIPILVTDGLRDGSLPGSVGNDLENVTGTAAVPAGPGADFFTTGYQDEFESEPGGYSGYAYDAAAVMLLANAAAGENDGLAVRDQMTAVANPGGTEVNP